VFLPILYALAISLDVLIKNTKYLLRALRFQQLVVTLAFEVSGLFHKFIHVVIPQPRTVDIQLLAEQIQRLIVQIV
jgi:hypothetical protein